MCRNFQIFGSNLKVHLGINSLIIDSNLIITPFSELEAEEETIKDITSISNLLSSFMIL